MDKDIQHRKTDLPQFRPATDILEREDGFYIYMDLPGVDKQDLVIDLQEDQLTISAITSHPSSEGEHFSEMQFTNGEYRRSVSLSDIVDREKIKATLTNGVLELLLPMVEKTQPKRIKITSG